jgi:serine protein kinase
MSLEHLLEKIRTENLKNFESEDRLRTFEDFLKDFYENPYLYLRTAPQYLVEMFDHFGTDSVSRVGREVTRFRVFDAAEGGRSHGEYLVGQEHAQNKFYEFLTNFAQKGRADKMVLLHGPNGSGKTSFVECVCAGLENFSRTSEGELLRFSWIFSERDSNLEPIGFDSPQNPEDADSDESLALLEEKEISSKIPCEMNDPPIFLIPKELRKSIIDEAISKFDGAPKPNFNYALFLEGDLCPKCRTIYDAILSGARGDWMKVIRHVQVERYYISKRYRTGAVTIEPQGNIDSTVRQIQTERNWSLPTILRNQNLHEPVGDIVDANHGILEYSDFLKRPIEANKYLLTTCERGTVSLPHFMAYLDLVILGTSNEKQLSLFKRSSDFSSFKGRIELIEFPYLLMVSKETELYNNHIQLFSRDRHVTPHTAQTAASWAVLTRLKRPNPDYYEESLKSVVNGLSPTDKAALYDRGVSPLGLKEDEKKALRREIVKVRAEYDDSEGEFEGLFGAEYEGRRGASPREMMMLLAHAAENRKYSCVTPMAVFEAVEELCRDTSLYDYLRLPVQNGYHDVLQFIKDVRDRYVETVTEDVFNSIGLVEVSEYDRYFLEYFRNVKAFKSFEKIYVATTNSYENPNTELMERVEKLIDVKESADDFRSSVMAKIAAWSLDHPQVEIDYHDLFPNIYSALQKEFFRERNRILTLIEEDILKYGTEDFGDMSDEDQQRVVDVLGRMKEQHQYCDDCARDVIAFVLKMRAESE